MYMTGSSPGPTPDIPDSLMGNIRDVMRLRESKQEEFMKLRQRSSERASANDSMLKAPQNAWLNSGG
jgi:hypothetical protein